MSEQATTYQFPEQSPERGRLDVMAREHQVERPTSRLLSSAEKSALADVANALMTEEPTTPEFVKSPEYLISDALRIGDLLDAYRKDYRARNWSQDEAA